MKGVWVVNTVLGLLKEAEKLLSSRYPNGTPRLDAELLLSFVLEKTRLSLLTWPEQVVEQRQITQFKNLVIRRLAGEPIAYIVGYKEFWSLSFQVCKDVLIPRSETEILLEQTLQCLSADVRLDILELGTGSGAVAIALSKERPLWKILAVDYSKAALQQAQKNALALQAGQLEFLCSDWFSHLPQDKRFHAIISNPPYLSSDDNHLLEEGLCFEPREALVASQNGYAALSHIVKEASHYLLPKGYLLLEHGFLQGEKLRTMLRDAGFSQIKTLVDLANLERVTVAEF